MRFTGLFVLSSIALFIVLLWAPAMAAMVLEVVEGLDAVPSVEAYR